MADAKKGTLIVLEGDNQFYFDGEREGKSAFESLLTFKSL